MESDEACKSDSPEKLEDEVDGCEEGEGESEEVAPAATFEDEQAKNIEKRRLKFHSNYDTIL